MTEKVEKPKTGDSLIFEFLKENPTFETAKPGDRVDISGEQLLVYENGFKMLSARRLPNGKSEALVALLYGKHLRLSCEAFRSAMEKVDAELEDAELLDDNEEKIQRILDARKSKRELLAMKFSIKLPKVKLTRKNLPRVHKGNGGDMNQAQNSAIEIALTPMFFDGGTIEDAEKESEKDADGAAE